MHIGIDIRSLASPTRTRLPHEKTFLVGDMIVVFGEKAEGSLIQAIGIQKIPN
jgi:hypothetical protein